MMEAKLKHLEFLQHVITRMNSNSFLLKGWAVTLIAAIFALAANDSNFEYSIVSFLVVGIFWIMDGFYLSQERQFRALYDSVRIMDASNINFSMSTKDFNNGKNTWVRGIFSKTIGPFYGCLSGITIIIMVLFIIFDC